MGNDRRVIAVICYIVLGAVLLVLYWVSFLVLSKKC